MSFTKAIVDPLAPMIAQVEHLYHMSMRVYSLELSLILALFCLVTFWLILRKVRFMIGYSKSKQRLLKELIGLYENKASKARRPKRPTRRTPAY